MVVPVLIERFHMERTEFPPATRAFPCNMQSKAFDHHIECSLSHGRGLDLSSTHPGTFNELRLSLSGILATAGGLRISSPTSESRSSATFRKANLRDVPSPQTQKRLRDFVDRDYTRRQRRFSVLISDGANVVVADEPFDFARALLFKAILRALG
jgi:hypothetical protein